ncbi:MAG: transcription elongation factor [Mesorhizobium amorphae]|nr:MAG: transcription elongation factor [Mesorhizobium amorphae]
MSRAFTKEDETGDGLGGIGERPVSAHRNLVTPGGLAAMDAELARLREELAEAGGERERVAHLSRDLRYWTARRETAELSVPDPGSDVVRFGMSVRVAAEDGRENTWRIVGEDEADAGQGTISHVSPMARALFGKGVGEEAVVNGVWWEILWVRGDG